MCRSGGSSGTGSGSETGEVGVQRYPSCERYVFRGHEAPPILPSCVPQEMIWLMCDLNSRSDRRRQQAYVKHLDFNGFGLGNFEVLGVGDWVTVRQPCKGRLFRRCNLTNIRCAEGHAVVDILS